MPIQIIVKLISYTYASCLDLIPLSTSGVHGRSLWQLHWRVSRYSNQLPIPTTGIQQPAFLGSSKVHLLHHEGDTARRANIGDVPKRIFSVSPKVANYFQRRLRSSIPGLPYTFAKRCFPVNYINSLRCMD